VALGVVVTELASDGRFSENLLSLATAGGGAALLALGGARRLVQLLRQFAGGVVLLTPFAAAAGLRRLMRRDISAFDLGALFAMCVTILVLSDVGAYINHLLDVGRARGRPGRVGLRRRWSCGGRPERHAPGRRRDRPSISLMSYLGPHAREAAADLRSGNDTSYGAEQLRGQVPDDATLLAQDPGVPYALGRRPVVNDAFMLPRIAGSRPAAIEALRQRIDRQEFDVVVLNNPLTHQPFYADGDFGATIATTLCRRYRLDREVGGYLLYVPGPSSIDCPAPATRTAPT
jgi:hypothetical protein